MNRRRGFTLIELLIVIAIIAILALIAVPNFLEAQTRAKVSRAMADMRSIATAIESYMVDYNTYPLNGGDYYTESGGGWYYTIPYELTTPIAYITSAKLLDPFVNTIDPVPPSAPGEAAIHPNLNYHKVVTPEQRVELVAVGRTPPNEAVDDCDPFMATTYNCGAFEKYGYWKLVSVGPDALYWQKPSTVYNAPLWGSDEMYDPTNGTISFGNVIRTQLDAGGIKRDN